MSEAFSTTDRTSPNGPLSTLSLLWKRAGHKKIYSQYERPPFPIVTDKPTFGNVISNLQFSDLCAFAFFYTAGYPIAWFAGRHGGGLKPRLLVMNVVSHSFSLLGMFMAFNGSYLRLTGFWDNGLRWTTPDNRFKKFDTTSVYEENTMFGLVSRIK